jgi:hypothetical protein
VITSNDIRPEKQIYSLGALLLEVLRKAPSDRIELFEAYEEMKLTTGMSISVFVLTLDWLFLLGAVKAEEGAIVKCF